MTLRCEGTVRGVGGIRLAGEDCATDVPGLYAAGDAASRERLTGAISGGGGPNSSWAVASGNWAAGPPRSSRVSRQSRHRGPRRAARACRPAAGSRGAPIGELQGGGNRDLIAAVREEMLPLDRNFFRTAPGLAARWRGSTGTGRFWPGARVRTNGAAGARGGGADRDRPLGLSQRAGAGREPRDAAPPRLPASRSEFSVRDRDRRARPRHRRAPRPRPGAPAA